MSRIARHPFHPLTAFGFWSGLSREKRVTLIRATTAYSIDAIDDRSMATVLKRFDPSLTLPAAHSLLRGNGPLLLLFKTELYRVYYSRAIQRKPAAPTVFVPFVEESLASPLVRSRLKEIADVGCSPVTANEATERIAQVLQSRDLRDYMRAFIHRKMLFILRSHPYTVQEIISDLQRNALFNLLRIYPHWADDGHMIAVAKNAARNRGHTFIKECASLSRARHDRQNNRLDVALDPEIAASVLETSLPCSALDGSSRSQAEIDDSHSVIALLESPRIPKEARFFLSLMAGRHNAAFTQFVGQDNSEFIHKVSGALYASRVRAFLGITPQTASAHFDLARRHLGS